MILSTFLDSVVSKTLAFLGRKDDRHVIYALLEWRSNSILQLQRLLHENLGMGTWSSASNQVPVTERGEKIGVIDTSDPKHPRMTRPLYPRSENGSDYESGIENGETVNLSTNKMYAPL